jgi:hypothetical protein
LSGGRTVEVPSCEAVNEEPEPITLEQLRDKYVETMAISIEKNSLETLKMHLRHVIRTLGGSFQLDGLGLNNPCRSTSIAARRRKGWWTGPAAFRRAAGSRGAGNRGPRRETRRTGSVADGKCEGGRRAKRGGMLRSYPLAGSGNYTVAPEPTHCFLGVGEAFQGLLDLQ